MLGVVGPPVVRNVLRSTQSGTSVYGDGKGKDDRVSYSFNSETLHRR